VIRSIGAPGRAPQRALAPLYTADILSMPDNGDPWYAAWDLAFHILSLTLVDEDSARSNYRCCSAGIICTPTASCRAYEWNFGASTPLCHAWAVMFIYRRETSERGRRSRAATALFHKLLLNFTWWVNRKDRTGRNVLKGASWGWTTLACSTAARRCRPALLEQADAPPGWHSSAKHARNGRGAGGQRAGLRGHGPSSSLSTFCGSLRP